MNLKLQKTIFDCLWLIALLLIAAGMILAGVLFCIGGFATLLSSGPLLALLFASANKFISLSEDADRELKERNAPYRLR